MQTSKNVREIISILKELHNTYKNQALSTHIAIAFADYKNFDGISDKEFLFALTKYKSEKDLDYSPTHDEEELNRIIEEGMNLDNILIKEEQEEEYYDSF